MELFYCVYNTEDKLAFLVNKFLEWWCDALFSEIKTVVLKLFKVNDINDCVYKFILKRRDLIL